MDTVSIFLKRDKIPISLRKILEDESAKCGKSIKSVMTSSVKEKIRDIKTTVSRKKSAMSKSRNTFVDKEIKIPLHIPYEIYSRICKKAETRGYSAEIYIIDILRIEAKKSDFASEKTITTKKS